MHVHNIITVIGATKFKKNLLQIVLLLIGMNCLTVKNIYMGIMTQHMGLEIYHY